MEAEGRNRDSSFVGLAKIRAQHAQQVAKFEEWADGAKWDQFHRQHFDWWTFPIDLPSTNYALAYTLGRADAKDLLDDPSFLSLYRKGSAAPLSSHRTGSTNHLTGVELIALSWGWNIQQQQPVSDPGTRHFASLMWGRRLLMPIQASGSAGVDTTFGCVRSVNHFSSSAKWISTLHLTSTAVHLSSYVSSLNGHNVS
jgi:hypothetical protein